jgi:hypothetical protein
MKTRSLTSSKADGAIHLGQAYFTISSRTSFLCTRQEACSPYESVPFTSSSSYQPTTPAYPLSLSLLSLPAPLQNYISGGDPQASTVVSSPAMPPSEGRGRVWT